MCAVLAAVLYFGWPIIEAIIIVLPIPDPQYLKQKIMNGVILLKSLPAAFKGDGKKETETVGVASGYR
jgi:hypothetical protein